MLGRTIADSVLDPQLPLRLTLLILVLRPSAEGVVRGSTWLVACAALVIPPLARSSALWLTLSVLVMVRLIHDWPLADNHIYLLAYWCLGIGLCLRVPASVPAMATMSRWLVGGCFLCAVVWKGVLAPDFLDARFFRVALITDDRFAPLARAAGSLTAAQLQANRTALIGLPAGAEILDGPVLIEPPGLRRLGLALTWGGFLLECAIAWAFLSRRPRALHEARHTLLMTFALATYAAAPVAGFGWLLAAMGMAQSAAPRRRAAYLAVFAIVLVYAETPIVPYLLGAISP
ncbi:MAG TPA: hypothetical protein VFJ02_23120 [Vicinamibacterales bacterium]|nr:hypothetical protein [Vicinamibacterales bacterium]